MTTNSTAASPQKFLSAKFAVKATTIAALALAGSLAAVAPAAQAQRLDPPAAPYNCSQWGFNGQTTFDQSSGTYVRFTSTGPQAQGLVKFVDEHFENTLPTRYGTVSGGIVNGQGIDIQAHWESGVTWRYSGEIEADGSVSGNVYGPPLPGTQTPPANDRYTAPAGTFTCITPAAAPAPTDTPVVLAPGAKDAPPPPVITTPIGRTSVQIKSGPATLQAGLSGTYVVTVTNTFTDAKPVRISVIFAGKLEQTGPVNAQGGLDCVVGHDVGINAAVNCTGPIPQGSYDIVVQGRGSAPGAGQLLAKLDNDTKQQNVTIT